MTAKIGLPNSISSYLVLCTIVIVILAGAEMPAAETFAAESSLLFDQSAGIGKPGSLFPDLSLLEEDSLELPRSPTEKVIVPPLGPATSPDSLIKEKSPTGALFRSLALPGWGQIYTGNYLRAAMYGVGEVILIGAIYNFWNLTEDHKSEFEFAQEYNRGGFLHTAGVTVVPGDTRFQLPEIPEEQKEFDLYQRFQDKRNFYLWITAAWVFVSMFDAYVCAHLYNFDKLSQGEFSIDFRIEEAGPDKTCKLTVTRRF